MTELISGPTATTNLGSIRMRRDIAKGPKCLLNPPKIKTVKYRRRKRRKSC